MFSQEDYFADHVTNRLQGAENKVRQTIQKEITIIQVDNDETLHQNNGNKEAWADINNVREGKWTGDRWNHSKWEA